MRVSNSDGMLRRVRAHASSAFALVPVACAALVFYPIAGSYFAGDDFLNLYHIANDHLLKYLVTPNSGHELVVRNAIFYVTARLFGPDPRWFYTTAFLTHLVNVWLAFRVIRRLTGRPGLAAAGATMWGVAPANAGSVGWYSVYGHVLVGTALLVILDQLLDVADREAEPSRRMRALWYGLALAAATCFGTGIAVAMSLPFVLLMVLPAGTSRPARRLPLASLLLTVPGLYALLMWAYGRLSLPGEEFMPMPRLLAAIWAAPTSIVPFWARLVALGVGRLPLGFCFPAWVQRPPILTALVVAFVLMLVLAVQRASTQVRGRLAALGLLLVASYGIIALGRAWLVQYPKFLENTDRYHYVGQLVATLLLCLVVHLLTMGAATTVKRVALVGWFAFAAATYLVCARPIDQNADARRATEGFLASVVEQAHALPPGARVYLPLTAFYPAQLPSQMFAGTAAAFLIFFPTDRVDGREVRFVERSPEVLDVLRRGRRTATLVVSPAEAAMDVPTR
jgi:hypothetical protein